MPEPVALPERSAAQWSAPEYWEGLTRATAHLDPPVAVLSLPALAANAHDLRCRAGGTRIRVASKSLRVRSVLDSVLAQPGFGGVLAYTLAEALWLAAPSGSHRAIDDIVVGYPTVDREAIARLASDEDAAARVTLMVDSIDHLELIDSVVPPTARSCVRLCLELDASWDSRALGHVGTWRSPVHTVAQARALAEAIVGRPGFALVGMMAYEGQLAGLADDSGPAGGAIIRWAKRRSTLELAERRALAVAAVRDVAALEFVNGGGTGSLESTTAEVAVTEVAAGSGLFGPHLFDHYRSFSPAPAAAFALPVVRKPRPHLATLLGGGWIASGPPGTDRLPLAMWPEGLRMLPREMAGEVQTPLAGPGAARLAVGDRVWLRHSKAGELSEHVNEYALVDGEVGNEVVVGTAPTYRGDGMAFL
ncbi:amino acid deaminase/aldolase [Salinibacterium sp. dk2585]|uniref:alanine racemase n=1 Tax=unclassified Salinibacterium TaxID=2632331 RepID=UPI0011C255A7|nr:MULTISPECIES: alanine racemase [unclassified Salinibacterium]QEE61939.1 amino acid deaminase/aldolase [Salinibacterium sp. dk2585]TXK54506.1 amino acid deaminase/aldolase [Salinibacterium sp. dk5596]